MCGRSGGISARPFGVTTQPEVDGFLELVTERMEELVKENLAFRAEVEQLTEKAVVQEGREQAVQEALVTAQELREDVKQQAHREAKLLEREARGRVEGMILDIREAPHGAPLPPSTSWSGNANVS